jgi:Cu+-exporting ATPase
MALEPREVSTDEKPSVELMAMKRRLSWCALPASLVFLIGMSDALPGMPLQSLIGARIEDWIEFTVATPVVLWGAWPFFERAWRSLISRNLNMFTLFGLGIGVAYAYSVVALLLPTSFPTAFRGEGGAVEVYFEASAVIVVLVLLGQVLELGARSKTHAAVRALLHLAPKTALRIGPGGVSEDVSLEAVSVGDLLRVKPGESVPVDGVVVEGTSSIDESMVTGESIPIEKNPGDGLIGATMNGSGSLLMRTEQVGAGTLLARIVRMVDDAQRSRAPIQKLADRFAAWFVPAVVTAAILTFAGWAIFGPEPRMAHGIVNAVAVLIIACPCALGLATPMSIMVATGKAASAGVLFSNAEAIESMSKIDTLVVDKTGTLTEGRPALASVVMAESASSGSANLQEDALVGLAASLEQGSEHPLAAAIVAGAKARGLTLAKTVGFEAVAGKGVTGTVDGRHVALGNAALLADLHVDTAGYLARAESMRQQGQTVMFVVVGGSLAGLVGVSDPLKANAAQAIRDLRGEGIRIVMLTGDAKTTADAVGRALGIDEVIAGVLPNEKAQTIRRLQNEGHVVAMAGDGVNDAPALAQAQVGIAMSTGADVAMKSAGVTLVRGDLSGIARARRLSVATLGNIKVGLFFAFVYNLLGVPLAAGVLYPAFGILLSPMLAALAMSLSSVSVIANALRLRRMRL